MTDYYRMLHDCMSRGNVIMEDDNDCESCFYGGVKARKYLDGTVRFFRISKHDGVPYKELTGDEVERFYNENFLNK